MSEADDSEAPVWSAVAGLRMAYPPERPDLVLVELKTSQGPFRLSLTKEVAKRLAEEISKAADRLTPERDGAN